MATAAVAVPATRTKKGRRSNKTEPDGESRHRKWQDEEVRALVNIWGEDEIQKLLHCYEERRSTNVYGLIAEKLGTVGYTRTASQCKVKMKSLKREYWARKKGRIHSSHLALHLGRCAQACLVMDRLLTGAESRRYMATPRTSTSQNTRKKKKKKQEGSATPQVQSVNMERQPRHWVESETIPREVPLVPVAPYTSCRQQTAEAVPRIFQRPQEELRPNTAPSSAVQDKLQVFSEPNGESQPGPSMTGTFFHRAAIRSNSDHTGKLISDMCNSIAGESNWYSAAAPETPDTRSICTLWNTRFCNGFIG